MTTTTSTSNTDRIHELARSLRDPAVLADPKAFDKARSEHERLTLIASVEAEAEAKRAADEAAARAATAAEKHAAEVAAVIQRGNIDPQLEVVADRLTRALVAAETEIGSLLEQHRHALNDARRLGAIGAFAEPMYSGQTPPGKVTSYLRPEVLALRVRAELAKRLGGHSVDRMIVNAFPKGS